ncbi:MAG: Pr6Pr family membrane protein [Defluviitaleaceae bacterium]|nr:Pr6Pr family membrane protein [Defluviitaleaceae bacterium]
MEQKLLVKILSTIYKISLFIIICIALYKEIYADGVIVKEAFYYFTIQSNILTAFCLSIFIFMPWNSRIKCLVRGISLLAITLTGIVYNFVLYNIFLDWGTVGYTFSRTVTHVIAPLGFILDWTFFDKHGMMKIKDIFIWVTYPTAYYLISVYLDYHYNFSIYFFLNSADGYAAMFKWLIILLCVMAIVSFLFVKLDKET